MKIIEFEKSINLLSKGRNLSSGKHFRYFFLSFLFTGLLMSETIDFNITLQPIQNDLFQLYQNSQATKIGFGGARGGTKSHSADDLMLIRRLKYPNTSGLIVMRFLDDVKDIHIRPLLSRFPILDSWYHRQDKLITFPNGSFVRFISVENFDELKKRAGRGFTDVLVDQSELFTQEEIEFLYTINRYTPMNESDELLDITPKILLCFNPGGIGHGYHKRLFVEKDFEGNEDSQDFAFLQALGWDNAYWSLQSLKKEGFTIQDYHKWDNDKRFNYFVTKSQYGKKLNQLPDSQRQAQLFGSFDVFEGQFFSNFRRSHHVINHNFNPAFNTLGGIDYGNVSVLEILQRDYEGTIVPFGEVYMELETPTERALAIAEYLEERKLYKLQIIVDTDMDISQISNVEYSKKPIEIFRDVFKQRMGDNAPMLTVVHKTSLDNKKQYRQSINDAVKDYLRVYENSDGKKVSKLYIANACPMLIKSFAELIHDPRNQNGIDYDNTHPQRHQFDAFKYAFQGLWTPREPVKKKTAWAEKQLHKSQQQNFEVGMD